MDFYSYKSFLKKEYPSAYEFLGQHTWKPLFFSEFVPLSFEVYKQMEQVVKTLFQLKNRADYQKSLSMDIPDTALKQQKQDSVLMAYDFHIKEEEPKLIEVNTNASSFLLVNSLYQFKNLSYKKAQEDLKKSFQSEWEKFNKHKRDNKIREGMEKSGREARRGKESEMDKKNKKSKAPQKTVLIDEDTLNQKMAIEFFMYKDFFQSMNWPFEICDSRSLKTDDEGYLYTSGGDRVDFVYNRSTDFYFEDHPHLAKAYLKGTCAISPNPREYYLLSDKNRLCDLFYQKDRRLELNRIKNNIPFSEILNPENRNKAWASRKKYFFKIHRGYGGKLAYRGAGLTHKKFDELCNLKSLIQEFIPPSVIKDSKGTEWKTDFRAYVYENKIQQLTARCYQGQLTNFRQEGSGFACVNVY